MNREELLMDYLYGEMNEEQRQAFEKMIAADPDLARELAELQDTRSLMAELDEVQPTPTVVSIQQYVSPWKKWRWPLGIAASFLLLLSWLNPRLQVGNGALTFSLGKVAVAESNAEPAFDVEALYDKTAAMLKEQEERLDRKVLQVDASWQEKWRQQEQHMVVNWQRQQKRQTEEIIAQFQSEQLPEIASLVQSLQIQQQQELQSLLTNFWQEYQKTRLSDLESIGTEFTNVYNNVELNKNETEAMFVNLLSNGDL